MQLKFAVILCFLSFNILYAQVEDVQVVHPVYDFLLHAETRGFLPHYSHASLPLPRNQVIEALKMIRAHYDELDNWEKSTLLRFETEFEIVDRTNAVVFYSSSDSNEVLSSRMFGNDEKFIYHYKDSATNVNILPLGSIDYMRSIEESRSDYVLLGNLGLRLHGTIGGVLGYYLQATNGTVISGKKYVALEDRKLSRNVKFAYLNSDFDFSESHVRFEYNWFYASIGRETRLLGSGINQRLVLSSNAPPEDALSVGARFGSFEYRYTHSSLLALSESDFEFGVRAFIPQKYSATHRFALKPKWGEIAFWESVIYSDRNPDLAYLNPLSFFKNLEHSLHDRDNSMMGGDITIRPFDGLQLKGSYLLDDIIFGEIGKGFWSNKSAYNAGFIFALPGAIDVGAEYARVEPFTFSHFNKQNSMTNDSVLYGTYLLPNSDEFSLLIHWWWGNRYPVSVKFAYMRHGRNIYDSNGNLIKNVGADPLQTNRSEDPRYVTFLAGDKLYLSTLELRAGWEIIRGFNLQGLYSLISQNNEITHRFRLSFRFQDF